MDEECRLFQGPVAVLCQALLAGLALSTLIYKRSREVDKIDLGVWVLNVSKQVISLTAAHVFAILVSIFLSYKVDGQASPCSWYVVIFSVDTILGTFLTYLLHTGVVKGTKRYLTSTNVWNENGPEGVKHLTSCQSLCEKIATCGYYGTPPSLGTWAVQAAEWTCCILIARFICALVVYGLGPVVLEPVAEMVDGMFKGHYVLELFVVMIAYPLVINSLQALVQDAILRAKSSVKSYYTKIDGMAMQEFIHS